MWDWYNEDFIEETPKKHKKSISKLFKKLILKTIK